MFAGLLEMPRYEIILESFTKSISCLLFNCVSARKSELNLIFIIYLNNEKNNKNPRDFL